MSATTNVITLQAMLEIGSVLRTKEIRLYRLPGSSRGRGPNVAVWESDALVAVRYDDLDGIFARAISVVLLDELLPQAMVITGRHIPRLRGRTPVIVGWASRGTMSDRGDVAVTAVLDPDPSRGRRG